MMLPHLATRLYNTPLLIQRAKLDAILTVLGDRVGWTGPVAEVVLPSSRTLRDAQPGIAVIPVYGSLVRRGVGVEAASGLTAYPDIARQIEQALADPRIAGLVLEVDSPGGEAGGVFELGERIRAADGVKPIWALVADSAFSAAYALACGASRVVISRTGGVGSIGVIALHVDQSLRDAQDGYRFTAICAGERKNDFSPHAPLTEPAATRLQTEVDRLYGLFVTHVAALRKLSEKNVRAMQAGLYFGPEAVATGLADAEGSLESTLIEFSDFLLPRSVFATPISTALVSDLENTPMIAPAPHVVTDHQPVPEDQSTDTPATVDETDPPDEIIHPSPETLPSRETLAAEARSAARNEAQAIVELCLIAGMPQRAAEFLAAGMSESQIRRTLLAQRAEQPEIASRITPEAGTSLRPEQSPVVAAVKKLHAQE